MTRSTCAGIALALLPQLCAAQKTPKKAGYNFPPQMREEVRKEFQKQCDKGQILYGIHCGGCHNMKDSKGRWVIPDFTAVQINGYEIRGGNPQHQDALGEDALNAEELSFISTFLSYKKQSGVVPVFPDKKTP